MGDVSGVASPKATVSVVNSSNEMVHLSELRLSCGCLKSDFEPTSLSAGQTLDCVVTLSEPGPGAGRQFGRFMTDDSTSLDFELKYLVTQTSYLYPDTMILGAIRHAKVSWPLRVSFKLMELPDDVKLLEPMKIEGNAAFKCAVVDSDFVNGGRIDLDMLPQDDPRGGTFRDALVIVANTSDGVKRFHVTIAGNLLLDR
jgi:hypothetical protein